LEQRRGLGRGAPPPVSSSRLSFARLEEAFRTPRRWP
jgi:hypothetical protein